MSCPWSKLRWLFQALDLEEQCNILPQAETRQRETLHSDLLSYLELHSAQLPFLVHLPPNSIASPQKQLCCFWSGISCNDVCDCTEISRYRPGKKELHWFFAITCLRQSQIKCKRKSSSSFFFAPVKKASGASWRIYNSFLQQMSVLICLFHYPNASFHPLLYQQTFQKYGKSPFQARTLFFFLTFSCSNIALWMCPNLFKMQIW